MQSASQAKRRSGVLEANHGRRARRSCGALLLFAWASPGTLGAQAGSAELREIETRLDEARAAAVHLLAPRSFEQALDRFEDAARRFDSGRADADFHDLLADALARLGESEQTAEIARALLAEALAGRDAAVAAEAEARAARAWQRAEAELEQAGRRFERDDREAAAERGGRAVVLYQRAARAAWRDLLLGAAVEARAAAMTVGASELAPVAFTEGEQLLAVGEAEIEAGRPDGQAAVGEAALRAFERSTVIATLADSVRRRSVSVERLVTAHESDLATLAEAAGVEAHPDRTGETTERISAELRRIQAENRRLEGELDAARADAARLSDQTDSLEERLGDSERRFVEVRDDLLERRQREERLREAQGLFTPAEGEVFLSGNRLVLRLYGLTFESGQAEIEEGHYPLLTKVQRVIRTFEGAGIRVEGHTDSRGGAEANEALSQRRAIAVREHLLSRIPIPSSRVEAVGLGEEQPIGSNETEEGRAKNRRIEVVVTLPGG